LKISQAFDTFVPSSGEELNKYVSKDTKLKISNNVSKYPFFLHTLKNKGVLRRVFKSPLLPIFETLFQDAFA
jgi:hypothetical protein